MRPGGVRSFALELARGPAGAYHRGERLCDRLLLEAAAPLRVRAIEVAGRGGHALARGPKRRCQRGVQRLRGRRDVPAAAAAAPPRPHGQPVAGQRLQKERVCAPAQYCMAAEDVGSLGCPAASSRLSQTPLYPSAKWAEVGGRRQLRPGSLPADPFLPTLHTVDGLPTVFQPRPNSAQVQGDSSQASCGNPGRSGRGPGGTALPLWLKGNWGWFHSPATSLKQWRAKLEELGCDLC